MYNEKYDKTAQENNVMTMKSVASENYGRGIVGEVLDYAIHKDGRRELLRHDKNLIVDGCSTLIATLMKNEAGYSGVQYWAVGEGSNTWSNETPPSPLVTDTQLLAETYRKAISAGDIIFIDDLNAESLTPTNRIQITVLFGSAEANGELREFAIFGGDATATVNSGVMVNRKIHPLIYKTTEIELERIIRFTF